MSEQQEDWRGVVRAWWPATKQVMIVNHAIGKQITLMDNQIVGKYYDNAPGLVQYAEDGSVKFIIDR